MVYTYHAVEPWSKHKNPDAEEAFNLEFGHEYGSHFDSHDLAGIPASVYDEFMHITYCKTSNPSMLRSWVEQMSPESWFGRYCRICLSHDVDIQEY